MTPHESKRNATPFRRYRNARVVVPCLVVIAAMLGLVAYSPTLYRLFCAATGFGGTTRRADSASGPASGRAITVRFDTNVAPNLPWRFEPVEREVTVRLGEERLVFFTAENTGDRTIVGHATFNVTPETTGAYFNKIQCFCFDDERLGAHQKVDMPVTFFVDPALAADPETKSIDTITLSYTFFRSTESDRTKDLGRFVSNSERGKQLFENRCAACHAADFDKVGPALAGVMGRSAGSVVGYRYSEALSKSGITWSEVTLDRWLADPHKLVPGTRMPVRVTNPDDRQAILVYLRQLQRRAEGGAPDTRSR